MGFTDIIFLMASVAVVGPLLAHLFNRSKYRSLPFTMLKFLDISQKQTQSKRRFHDFLILLLRCIIIVLIAILFAGPVIYKQISKTMSKDIHFVLLDDSLSMSCKDSSGSCFDQMVSQACDYLERNKGPSSIFNLYSMTQSIIAKNLSAEAAELLVKDMEIGYGRSDLTELLADIKTVSGGRKQGNTVSVHVISDFTDEVIDTFYSQVGITNVDESSFNVTSENLKPNNLAIVDGSVINVDEKSLALSATVVNFGSKQSKRLIRAEIETNYSNEVIVNPAPSEQENVLLTLDISQLPSNMAFLPIEIKLLPDDDLLADDIYRIAVSTGSNHKKRLLLLGHEKKELFLIQTALDMLQQSADSCIKSVDTELYSSFSPERIFSYDIIFVSSVDRSFGTYAKQIGKYIEAGGQWIFFSDDRIDDKTATILYEQDILPAFPKRSVTAIGHIGKLNRDIENSGSSEGRILSILAQYDLETLPLWQYYQCMQLPETKSYWPIDPKASLVYQKVYHKGKCTFVNTSIDDSRSSLTKSPAVLPFVQYLSSESHQSQQYQFACDETVMVPVAQMEEGGKVSYLDTRGEKKTCVVIGSMLQITGPHTCGWIRTLAEPICYAGVNTIKGETCLKRNFSGRIEEAMASVFVKNKENEGLYAGISFSKETMALDKILIWGIILLILTDCFIANRMQRS